MPANLPAPLSDDEILDHVVWSFEHRAWWGPESRGYVGNILWAGLYTKAEAEQIAADANRYAKKPKEEARQVDVALAQTLAATPTPWGVNVGSRLLAERAELQRELVKWKESKFSLEGIPTDGRGNPLSSSPSATGGANG